MVTNPRTTARADQLRPLNSPKPLAVIVAEGRPSALVDGAEPITIDDILDRWAVDDEWWRAPIRRRYYRVLVASGAVRTIYHDVVHDGWFEQAY